VRLVVARLSAAHHQLATKEFFVVQGFDRSFRFLNCLHLHKGKALGTLVMAVTDHLRVLNVSDAVEQLEQIALGRVEREIAHIKPGRRNFDRLGFTLRPWLALLLLLMLRLMRLLMR